MVKKKFSKNSQKKRKSQKKRVCTRFFFSQNAESHRKNLLISVNLYFHGKTSKVTKKTLLGSPWTSSGVRSMDLEHRFLDLFEPFSTSNLAKIRWYWLGKVPEFVSIYVLS